MANKNLMKSQMNEIFELITNRELAPTSFKWKNVGSILDKSIDVQRLILRDTEYYFSFNNISGGYWNLSFSPGLQRLEDEVDNCRSWQDVTRIFGIWLTCLTREMEQPDLWQEINQYNLGYTEWSQDNNNLFTFNEATRIIDGVNNVRTYLLEQSVEDESQSQIINDKMDYLINSAKIMGRKDWGNIFVGALLNLFITLSIEPEKGKIVIDIFKSTLGGIIKLISG